MDATPVWFMRQAGRYMPEYRAIRARHSMLDLCRTPELACEITLQPVERLEVDAAIIFSDLLIPLAPMGLPFDFLKGEGPVFERPLRDPADVDRLRHFDPREGLPFALDALRLVRKALDGRVPLIGFAGAPFTLAAYAIEGGHSSSFAVTKTFMYTHPAAWHRLCERLVAIIGPYLRAQAEAGAQALQVFDSWVGALGPDDYREFVLPHSKALFDRLDGLDVPTIHFGTGTTCLLRLMREAGGDVVGADWRIPLDEAWTRIGEDRGIQGNLDPTRLFGPLEGLLSAADDVLSRAAGRAGHVFNLGHGILPGTPVEHVQALARHVHEASRRPRA